MTPYYEDDAVTIYHGDCREWMPKADVLVTDPPYGVDFQGKRSHDRKRIGSTYTVGDTEIAPAVVRTALDFVTRGAVFSGCRQMFDYPRPVDIGGIVTPGSPGFGSWGFTEFQPILFYGKRAGQTTNIVAVRSDTATQGIDHPCPKPLGWMRWLVVRVSLQGETILDPFCGSGTTLRAAKDLGRQAIGIEIEERYCEIAAQRCAQEVLEIA